MKNVLIPSERGILPGVLWRHSSKNRPRQSAVEFFTGYTLEEREQDRSFKYSEPIICPGRIDPALSYQAHISKKIPRDRAVNLDVRVYAPQTPGRMIRSERQRTFKTLTSEVTSSRRLRYGPDRTGRDQ